MAGKRFSPRSKGTPRPLDAARLEELALAYVARFAVSEAKLADYLKRKLRERGWDDGTGESDPDYGPDSSPDLGAIVSRYASLGYVDDETYARGKSAGLLRRGYGPRRIAQALGMAGITEELRQNLRASEGAARSAAITMARKRGFGPFGRTVPDQAVREKQIAAMLRAGHSLDTARELVDAPDAAAAEDWVAAAIADEAAEQ